MPYYLPFAKINYLTHLPAQEVGKRITANMDMDKKHGQVFNFGRLGKKKEHRYSGYASGHTFSMYRNINYRNSFLPMIKGEVKDSPSGTEVNVTLELHTFVKVFGFIWGGGALMGAIIATFVIFSGANEAGFAILIPFAMLIFGYGMFTIPFNIEVNTFKRDMEAWLEMDRRD